MTVSHETQSTALEMLLSLVCEAHGLTPLAVRSRRRNKQLFEARKDFSQMARSFGYSYPKIGKFMGKHHTSIMHQVRS